MCCQKKITQFIDLEYFVNTLLTFAPMYCNIWAARARRDLSRFNYDAIPKVTEAIIAFWLLIHRCDLDL